MITRTNESIVKAFYKRRGLKDPNSENTFPDNTRIDATLLNPEKEFALFEFRDGLTFLDERMIEAYHPDRLDSRVFWREAVRNFPWVSTCGDVRATSVEQAKRMTWNIHENAINYLSDNVYALLPNATMLEIGPGYGNVKDHIGSNHGLENYYCIDVHPLFEYERMFQTDGSTIPDEVPYDLDIVYSNNVFQHLSDNQRRSYIDQVGDRLAIGGTFVFGLFLLTDWNKDMKYNGKYLFGNRDRNGECYTTFFNQFTRVPHEREVLQEVNDAGLIVTNLNRRSANYMEFWCTKT